MLCIVLNTAQKKNNNIEKNKKYNAKLRGKNGHDRSLGVKFVLTDLFGSDMFIVRVDSNGSVIGTSRPCTSCLKWLSKFGIKRVFYTTHFDSSLPSFEIVPSFPKNQGPCALSYKISWKMEKVDDMVKCLINDKSSVYVTPCQSKTKHMTRNSANHTK